MSALVLKSGNALNAGIESLDMTAYRYRVERDGGYVVDAAQVMAAYDFLKQNGIDKNQVFSATSARWGVKVVGGKPVKLYNLFDESGDIDVVVAYPAAIAFNETSYTHPVIEMRGRADNGLTSKGTVSGANSTGLCVIARVPNVTGVAAGTLAEMSVLTTSANTTELVAKRHLVTNTVKNSGAVDTTGWSHSALGYGSTYNSGATSAKNLDRMTDATAFISATRGALYNDGVLTSGSAITANNPIKDNLSLTIGRAKNLTAPASIVWSTPIWADIVEVWSLVNITESNMQALSARAASVY